jgi:hypothetical protein
MYNNSIEDLKNIIDYCLGASVMFFLQRLSNLYE